MTDAQDILSGRLAQAQGILNSLLIDEQHDNMVSAQLNHTLWAVDTLLEQAAEALKEMPYVSKPEATVMMDGEPILNLEKELIGVLREIVERIGIEEIRGSYLLDHIDESRPKHDKAAVNATPGEAS